MKNKNLKSTLNLTSGLAACIAASFTAAPVSLAQQITDDVSVQDTIVVTATRRAESIQDIPLNISALGSDQIERQGFGDISELASYVPGLNIADQGGRDGNRIVVRGLNAEPIQNAFGQQDGGGTVATYIGEIPLFVDLRMNDLERVEVLLGPQGTLYGAGTMGGAIRYIPVKPQFDEKTADFRTDIYTYSEGEGLSHDTGVTLNYGITDSFAVRASFDKLDDKGFIDYPFVVQQPGFSNPDPDFSNAVDVAANLNPQEDVNTESNYSGRIAVRAQPADWLDGTLTYYFQNQENGGRNTSGRRGILQTGDYESPQRVLEPNERKTDLFALEITADLGFAELTSATGLAKSEENGQRDQTDLLITLEYSYETFPTFTAFTFEDEKTEVFNQEVRLVSTNESRFNWMGGFFYNKNVYQALSSEFTPGYIEWFGAPLPQSGSLEYFSADRAELKESAIFGEIGYELTDKWDITFGARGYDYTFQTGNETQFPVADYLFFGVPADEVFSGYPLDNITANLALDPSTLQEDEGTLLKVNSSYTFDNGNMVYGTFSQGYRVGGRNAGAACPPFNSQTDAQDLCLLAAGQQFGPDAENDVRQLDEQVYKSDTVDNFELGAKTTWLDGDLILNGSVFFMNWNDPQVSTTTVFAGTSILANAGAAEAKGFDLSGQWQVTDAFNVRGTLGYVKAELTEGVPDLIRTIPTDAELAADANLTPFSTQFESGVAGDRLPGSPEIQFSLFGSYNFNLANGNTLTLDGGYAYQGDMLDEAGARGDSLTLDAYGRANASLTYAEDGWSITAYADNILDELAESSVASNALFNRNISGANVRSFRTNVLPPRSVGVRLKINFGG